MLLAPLDVSYFLVASKGTQSHSRRNETSRKLPCRFDFSFIEVLQGILRLPSSVLSSIPLPSNHCPQCIASGILHSDKANTVPHLVVVLLRTCSYICLTIAPAPSIRLRLSPSLSVMPRRLTYISSHGWLHSWDGITPHVAVIFLVIRWCSSASLSPL